MKDLLDMLLHNDVVYFVNHTTRFLKRLPKWLKVAWKQEDWDYEYLYDLIELKLQEFLIAQQEDTWHVQAETRKRALQIKVCLIRLDRFRNWTKYYDYPTEDLTEVKVETKFGPAYRMEYTNEENEKQRLGADKFIEYNYNKFWKDLIQWHQGWWT